MDVAIEKEKRGRKDDGGNRREIGDSPSLSLSHPDSPGFRPQATAHVLLQILVKKLKWIHEWSDGTHGVSAVAKCATTTIRVAASSPLVRASVVRLTTTRHHRGGGGSLFLRLFDRLIVSDCLLSSNFSLLFFFPLSFEMEKLFEEQREAKGREQLFFRRIIFRLSLFLESGFFFKRFGFSRIKSNENPSIQQLSPNGIERCKSRWWPRTNAPIQIGKNFLAKRLACCNSS